MGNLAVKCETQWQERKMDTSCVRRRTVDVRVMKADGSGVEEFERPVVAAEVMYQFSDYVVVQWCRRPNTKLGKWGQLRVLQRHEVLTPEEIYILSPIPFEVVKNHNATARRSRQMQSSKDRLSVLLQRSGTGTMTTANASKKERERLLRGDEKSSNNGRSEGVETPVPPFAGFRVEGWQPNSSGDETQEEKQTSGNEEQRLSTKPDLLINPFCAGSSWRPALLSIPESPIGFHSRSGSPIPISFRLVSVESSREKDQPK